MSSESRRPEVVVLGGTGMLGHRVLLALARAGVSTVATTRESRQRRPAWWDDWLSDEAVVPEFDARDLRSVEALLSGLRPRVVVNCVGVVKQKSEAHDAEISIAVNSLFPHAVARICRGWGGRLIHVSTDCVFAGDRGGYCEADRPDAPDLYGRSKALGEVVEGDALTIRTSIVGRQVTGSSSLLEWFLAEKGPEVKGYSGAFFSGVTTLELARVLTDLAVRPALTGLYHVAGPRISKFDLLTLFRDAFRKDLTIVRDESIVLDRSLDGRRFEAAAPWRAPGWAQMVDELAADPAPYDRWRTS
ncbi:MAG TPA: SDR family oxidoreductase [Thermoanaerobaculia bacterium]|nr:SDR family oxidoreductase [Thermoanaerobaculia bacterium]